LYLIRKKVTKAYKREKIKILTNICTKKIVCVIIGVISHKEVIRAMGLKVLILKALNSFLSIIIKILKSKRVNYKSGNST
jgi:hypothetical protein